LFGEPGQRKSQCLKQVRDYLWRDYWLKNGIISKIPILIDLHEAYDQNKEAEASHIIDNAVLQGLNLAQTENLSNLGVVFLFDAYDQLRSRGNPMQFAKYQNALTVITCRTTHKKKLIDNCKSVGISADAFAEVTLKEF